MGQTQLSRVLQGLEDVTGDWEPAFQLMADDYAATQGDVFDAQGGHEGLSPWAPLSPAYQEWKDQHFPGKPILELTGRLRAAMTLAGTGRVLQISERELVIGADIRVGKSGQWNLAALHQQGTRRMPSRPVLRLTEPQKRRWVGFLHKYLWEQMMELAMQHKIAEAVRLRTEREP